MAHPLSAALPLSDELHQIIGTADELAARSGQQVHSAHLLMALYSVESQAASFLDDHKLPHLRSTLSAELEHVREPSHTVRTIWDRCSRLANNNDAVTIDSMHLLAAILRESRSAAYKTLERAGLNISGIRTRAVKTKPAAAPSAPTPQPGAQLDDGYNLGIHPSLGGVGAVQPQRGRNRVRLQDRSSPVHPALHDRWLRTTPTDGVRAVRRARVEHPNQENLAGLTSDVWETPTPSTGAFNAVQPPPAPQAPPHYAQQAPQRPSTGVHKSLKERFAELKQQARKRRQRVDPPELEPHKMPPSVRRATRAPEPQEEEAVNEDKKAQARARQDAEETTRDLAARLFGKKKLTPKAAAPVEPEELVLDLPSLDAAPADIAQIDSIDVAEARPMRSTPPKKAKTSSAPKDRPDPSAATHYRLDPEVYPILSKFGRNLTEEAAMLRIDGVIGRDQEITSLIDILGKRRGNNPLLVGDPGVGKTAIVEGLAHKFCELHRRGVRLGGRAIIELELGRVLSGTHLRGSLSERLIAIKDEVRKADGQIIIFLDEIHAWLGAGNSGDGNDAAGELKTALARGQFPCIGATTNDEYTKFVEEDPAFKRRFQSVNVDEPDTATAIVIARGIRCHYERYHGITYADAAIDAAVRLSQRYIHDRRLPDKAVNVLDLAGSRASREARPFVRRTDIAHVVAEMANLPADRLTQSDRARFLEIERDLGRSVIGHERVIRAVAEVLRRNYAGFRSKRPIGSMLFLGPTGVGKTELVKALADFLFHDRDAIVRLDMSEFMEAHSVSRFIGAPPGYVGHEQGGQLTEAVRKRPYQVILLDEIEKAHPDVLNLLLQLLDEGRLTDGRSRVVDFSNTLIVMTSNLGAHCFDEYVAEANRSRIGFGGLLEQPASPTKQAELTKQVQESARTHFTPELWTRIDERLVFLPLREDEVAQISVLQLEDSAQRLEDESQISLDFSDEVIAHLIRHGGYDRKFGARPMRHTIQRLIEGHIARMILSGEIQRGESVMIDVDEEDKLIFYKPS